MDEGDWTWCNKDEVSCSIWDSGDLCASRGSVGLPDVSDSDRHDGLGIQHFLVPHVPPQPGLPIAVTRRGNVLSLQVWRSLVRSLAQPLCFANSPGHTFPVSSRVFPSPCSKTFSLFHFLPLSSTYSLLLFSRASPSGTWYGTSEVIGTEAKRAVNTCHFPKIMDNLFDEPPFVGVKDRLSGRVSEKHKMSGAVTFPFLCRHFGFCCSSGWQICVLRWYLFLVECENNFLCGWLYL